MHAVAAPAYVPAPLTDRVTILTPRGHAAVQLIRLSYELRDLGQLDRVYLAQMLRDLADEVTESA
jgi:hypothetical protein